MFVIIENWSLCQTCRKDVWNKNERKFQSWNNDKRRSLSIFQNWNSQGVYTKTGISSNHLIIDCNLYLSVSFNYHATCWLICSILNASKAWPLHRHIECSYPPAILVPIVFSTSRLIERNITLYSFFSWSYDLHEPEGVGFVISLVSSTESSTFVSPLVENRYDIKCVNETDVSKRDEKIHPHRKIVTSCL